MEFEKVRRIRELQRERQSDPVVKEARRRRDAIKSECEKLRIRELQRKRQSSPAVKEARRYRNAKRVESVIARVFDFCHYHTTQ